MAMRRILTAVLSFTVVLGPLTTGAAAQDSGTIAGRSNTVGSNYEVRIQSADTQQVVNRAALDANGQFSISGLMLPGRFLVVLHDTNRNRVVCSEGPYSLGAGSRAAASKTDVVISCSKKPAALWIGALAGAGGGAAALAFSLRSASN
ncbi:MAG: hypothetical protein ABL971_00130 [Vicinamibacterales bacterium]